MRQVASSFRRDEVAAQAEDTLSHPEYRALVVREARRSRRAPSSRDFYLAQKKVDAALGKLGAAIEIPGALPGRRTL